MITWVDSQDVAHQGTLVCEHAATYWVRETFPQPGRIVIVPRAWAQKEGKTS